MYANPKDPSLTGHFFIAMDISKIISKEQMKERMAQFKDRLKATPMWQEGAEMLLPGETGVPQRGGAPQGRTSHSRDDL